MPPILELCGITKRFPGVLANDKIDISLNKGEILALLGENGAGKTTLMNILYGLYQPDEGEIKINGEIKKIHSPTDAIKAGIGMVHQHFMLIPVFTVTDNVMLGAETTRNPFVSEKYQEKFAKYSDFLDRKTTADRIREISETYGLEVDPDVYIRDLPVGVQQRVEIIKLLFRQANIIILDEPTAVLTPQEVHELFKIMHSLTDQGKSIIFITHKLKEVLEIADRITVIRRGKVIGTTTPKEANQSKLASMMVGREVILDLKKKECKPTDVALSVKDLVVADQRGQVAIDGVSFDVHKGEILGVAGVQGNGQTELVEAITRLRNIADGEIKVLNSDISKSSPRQFTELGSAHIPEDRQRDGLVLTFPVMENLVLCTYYLPPYAKGPVIQWDVVRKNAQDLIKRFDIRTPDEDTNAGALSGGNQQKVIVARELSRPIELLIAAQPTRGLDVGSIEYIHGQILKKRDEGVAVLLVSTELDEIMQLSDRIAVMYRGKIVAIIPAATATKEYLGLLMAGIPQEQALQHLTQSALDVSH